MAHNTIGSTEFFQRLQDHQATLKMWAEAEFGPAEANSPQQRAIRLLEEAIETYQAAGGDLGMAWQLVEYVFNRPVGDPRQEVGGVMVTTLLFAHTLGLHAGICLEQEMTRILMKPRGAFRERNNEKNIAGFKAEGLE